MHFLTSVLDGGEWSVSLLGRFTPSGKSPFSPLDRRLGGPQSRSGYGKYIEMQFYVHRWKNVIWIVCTY
jgi:hypothetical protein